MSSKNQRFLDFASEVIKNDKDHPLQFLLNEHGTRVMTHSGGIGNYYDVEHSLIVEGRASNNNSIGHGWKSSDLADVLGSSVSVDACHMKTKNHGAEESFCLGIAEDNRASGHSEKSVEIFNDAIDIGGVPVDRRSADKWESVGLLEQGTVAKSHQSEGWSLPIESFTDKPNSVISDNDIDKAHAEMESFMRADRQSPMPWPSVHGDLGKTHAEMESFIGPGPQYGEPEYQTHQKLAEVGVDYVHDQQAPSQTHAFSLADDA
jgi:hypothetical protein